MVKVEIGENFWDCNPQSKFISHFNKVYKEDKSHKKEYSSKCIWAAILFSDPMRSQFYDMPEKMRKEEILQNFLNNAVPWEDVEQHIKPFQKLMLTPLERQLKSQQDKLVERQQFIMNTAYDVETAKLLDSLQVDTPKLLQAISQIEAQIKGEDGDVILRGGQEETISEKKLL